MTERNMTTVLGFDKLEQVGDNVVITWTVGEEHLQPFGIVHGGAYCAAHETAASWAAYSAVGDSGKIPVGANNSTDFLRQARAGEVITTTASPIQVGRTQQLWRVESVNEAGKLVAQGQVRLANIEAPPTA